MANNRQGSIHLCRVLGIDLFLHWSWFVVAVIEVEYRRHEYSSLIWGVLEYLALFLIVLLHEFGHALACRQVGGTANRILLWPLGGVAYVDPPQRPGAMLWSLAAGPLVNVVLLLPLGAAFVAQRSMGWALTMPNASRLITAVLWIDVVLLIFNLLPIYPLDGGQILRSLLWYVLGCGRSLAAATVLGFVGAAGFVIVALWTRSIWLALIAGYMILNCWSGLKGALGLMRLEKMPRHEGFACPGCGAKPVIGPRWRCAQCQGAFDIFASGAVCPHCGAQYSTTLCVACQKNWPIAAWTAAEEREAIASGAPVTR